jgi:hypothetical protein
MVVEHMSLGVEEQAGEGRFVNHQGRVAICYPEPPQ